MKQEAKSQPHKLLSIFCEKANPEHPDYHPIYAANGGEVEIRNADMKSLDAKNLFRIYLSGVRRVVVEMSDSSARVCGLIQFQGSVWIRL